MHAAIWLVIAVMFLVAEAATVQLVSIWFTCGAVCALLTSLITNSFIEQMVVFLVVSTVLLIFTKPFVAKFTAKSGAKTNADRLIGQSARLIEAVNNDLSQGALKLGGTTWSVKSITGESLPAGTRVVIEKIEGVTLYVRKEDE